MISVKGFWGEILYKRAIQCIQFQLYSLDCSKMWKRIFVKTHIRIYIGFVARHAKVHRKFRFEVIHHHHHSFIEFFNTFHCTSIVCVCRAFEYLIGHAKLSFFSTRVLFWLFLTFCHGENHYLPLTHFRWLKI